MSVSWGEIICWISEAESGDPSLNFQWQTIVITVTDIMPALNSIC